MSKKLKKERNGENNSEPPPTIDLQVDFYKTRLEHTLTHNREVTRLIYLIDTALLFALTYFFKGPGDFLGASNSSHYVSLVVGIAGAIINFLHFEFIGIQNAHYRAFSDKLIELLKLQPRKETSKSAGYKFQSIHISVTIVFLILALVSLFKLPLWNYFCRLCAE